jgi:hypothetical protein
MQTVEVSCPNCGSGEGVPAPHETRICKYCGTHYLLRPARQQEPQVPGETGQSDATQHLRIGDIFFAVGVMALLAAGAVLLVVMTNDKEETRSNWPSSNKWPSSYDAPRR